MTTTWDKCRQKVSAQLSAVKYNSLLLRVYDDSEPDKKKLIRPTEELLKALAKVLEAKRRIISTLQVAQATCSVDKQYAVMEGEFDVMDVFCSKCGGAEKVDNDILYCDRKHCNRAYHQQCLEPPLKTKDIPPGDEDFFCSACDCIDECIDHINEVCETSYTTVSSLFPEVVAADSKRKQEQDVEDGHSSDGTVQHSDEEIWPNDCSSDEDFTPGEDSDCESESGSDSDSDNGSDDNDREEDDDDSDSEDCEDNDRRCRSLCGSQSREDQEAESSDNPLLTCSRLRKRQKVDYIKLASELGYDESEAKLDEHDGDYK